MASPLTAYSPTTTNYVSGYSTTYAPARSTAYVASNPQTYLLVGQGYSAPNYSCYESFICFPDTSTIPVGAPINVAALSLYGLYNYAGSSWTTYAAVKDWGAAVTTADWVAGASLSGLTTVATLATSTSTPTNAYSPFTSDAAFLSNIVCGGTTGLLIYSGRHSAGNTPTGNEHIYWNRTATGKLPRLYVEYTDPVTGCPKQAMFYARLRG